MLSIDVKNYHIDDVSITLDRIDQYISIRQVLDITITNVIVSSCLSKLTNST